MTDTINWSDDTTRAPDGAGTRIFAVARAAGGGAMMTGKDLADVVANQFLALDLTTWVHGDLFGSTRGFAPPDEDLAMFEAFRVGVPQGRAEQVPPGARLVPTGRIAVCCPAHIRPHADRVEQLGGRVMDPWCCLTPCCDPVDCAPCCSECPTCPSARHDTTAEVRDRTGRRLEVITYNGDDDDDTLLVITDEILTDDGYLRGSPWRCEGGALVATVVALKDEYATRGARTVHVTRDQAWTAGPILSAVPR